MISPLAASTSSPCSEIRSRLCLFTALPLAKSKNIARISWWTALSSYQLSKQRVITANPRLLVLLDSKCQHLRTSVRISNQLKWRGWFPGQSTGICVTSPITLGKWFPSRKYQEALPSWDPIIRASLQPRVASSIIQVELLCSRQSFIPYQSLNNNV